MIIMLLRFQFGIELGTTSPEYNSSREFILVINQLDAQNLFYNKFISCLYMLRAPCAHNTIQF